MFPATSSAPKIGSVAVSATEQQVSRLFTFSQVIVAYNITEIISASGVQLHDEVHNGRPQSDGGEPERARCAGKHIEVPMVLADVDEVCECRLIF